MARKAGQLISRGSRTWLADQGRVPSRGGDTKRTSTDPAVSQRRQIPYYGGRLHGVAHLERPGYQGILLIASHQSCKS